MSVCWNCSLMELLCGQQVDSRQQQSHPRLGLMQSSDGGWWIRLWISPPQPSQQLPARTAEMLELV